MNYTYFRSPVGWLTLVSTGSALREVRFGRTEPAGMRKEVHPRGPAIRQLGEYFAGKRQRFDLPLELDGTPFQVAVWEALLEIPYGETRSYGEIASRLGRRGAARAVGMANHQNPLPIIVPCHRVIGSNGALTGYAGGLDLKNRLLSLEGALIMKGSSATVPIRGLSTAAPALS